MMGYLNLILVLINGALWIYFASYHPIAEETNIHSINIAILQTLVGVLGLFFALLAIIGYKQIKDSAELSAKNAADEIARQALELSDEELTIKIKRLIKEETEIQQHQDGLEIWQKEIEDFAKKLKSVTEAQED